jgi:mono/diheme cytochrome c family protein
MSARKLYCMAAVLLACAVYAIAQQPETPAQSTEKVIKHVPVRMTSAASAQEMYANYCAVCHATNGKGDGPAAAALKTPPPDLTLLAQKNGDKYPGMHVSSVIRGNADLPAHGSKDMPVWGPLFRTLSQGHEAEVQQRVANLNEYIESLQQK